MEESSMTDEAAKLIGTTQAGVTLVAALGLTALGRRAWSWCTRTYDETFLLALATHAAAFKRAEELRNPMGDIEERTRRELSRIANELVRQANVNIREAIVQRDWSMTRRSGIGPVGCAIGLFAFIIAISQMSPEGISTFWNWIAILGLLFALLILAIGYVVKLCWVKKRRSQMESAVG